MTASIRPVFLALIRDQRVRFLAVGGWNTLFGYLAFLAAFYIGGQAHPLRALVVSYCIALPQAYLTQRLLVFGGQDPVYRALPRFALANTTIFLANLGLLPVLQHVVSDPRVAQAVSLIVITCASYLAHKHFSFASRS